MLASCGGGCVVDVLEKNGASMSTGCQHLKTDLTPFTVRKLTWEPYGLWYTSSVKVSCENNVYRLPKNDWI